MSTGILGALLGGIAEGAAGSWEKQRTRQLEQEKHDRDIMTNFHLSQLADYEHLTPARAAFHANALDELHKQKPGTTMNMIQFGQGLADAYKKSLPPTLQAPPESLKAMGIDPTHPENISPEMTKFAQQEALRQLQAKQAADTKYAEQQREFADVSKLGEEGGIPKEKIAGAKIKRLTGADVIGFGGTLQKEGIYEAPDKSEHVLRINTKTGKLHDDATGLEYDHTPEGWIQKGPPAREVPPQLIQERTGEVSAVNRNALRREMEKTGATSAKIPGVKGRVQYPPIYNVTYPTSTGNLSIPTERNQAVRLGQQALRAAGAETGGTPPAPTFGAKLSTQGQQAIKAVDDGLATIKEAKAWLERHKLTNNNSQMALAGPAWQYYTLHQAPEFEGEAVPFTIMDISGLQQAAAMMRGVNNRHIKTMEKVFAHTPHMGGRISEPVTDTPKLLYQKYNDMEKVLQKSRQDIIRDESAGATGLTPPPEAPKTAAANPEGYGPLEQRTVNGQVRNVRKNLKTGKYKVE